MKQDKTDGTMKFFASVFWFEVLSFLSKFLVTYWDE